MSPQTRLYECAGSCSSCSSCSATPSAAAAAAAGATAAYSRPAAPASWPDRCTGSFCTGPHTSISCTCAACWPPVPHPHPPAGKHPPALNNSPHPPLPAYDAPPRPPGPPLHNNPPPGQPGLEPAPPNSCPRASSPAPKPFPQRSSRGTHHHHPHQRCSPQRCTSPTPPGRAASCS